MSERRTTVLGALLTAIGPISMAVYTPAMPQLVHVFATSESLIKMSLSLYFAGFAVAQLISGPMSDAYGRRAATLCFLMIYLAGSVIAALAPSVEWLLAARLIQGIGASVGVTVARAIVRDQFVGTEAARIMNLIGITLSVGPAAGPTIGGLALAAFGWQSVFLLMVVFGLLSCAIVACCMRETAIADRSWARPDRLLAAYAEVLANPRFVCASMVLAGAVGALYAQSTMLPFVLIDTVGLTPTQFGAGMLMQTGSYFTGSLSLRALSRRLDGQRAITVGLCFTIAGGLLIALSTQLVTPSFLSIMIPVGIATFGMAFITPYIVTAALAPFPHIAGSASAMLGFIQMSAGFLGGLAASLIGEPLDAFGIIIPTMELIAGIGYLGFRYTSRYRPA
jgi:Bcr/CflA subfamily drug resistance transporter